MTERIVAALSSPAAYAHPVGRVEVVQTHVSYVFLAGDYAYKVKKPLNLGFVDYSTVERRRFMCEEEVRLNQRLCAGVYLGVAPVTQVGESFRFGGEGIVVEYAVCMRRVPRDRMLDAMLKRGDAVTEVVRRVAREVAAFHARSAADELIASFGRPAAMRRNWDENFAQTEAFVGDVVLRGDVDAVRSYVARFLYAEQGLIEERAATGRVVDCHGDLRADAVYVHEDDGICVMDCIEFNDRIRYGDVAGDIGFLAMDLEHRGRVDLADELMGAYLADARDETLPLVLRFYKCYRAFVRGKVEAMRAVEPEVPTETRPASRDAARRLFKLAAQYAHESHPKRVFYTVGFSGSGKTWLANAFACRIGAVVLSTDVMREAPHGQSDGAAFGEGRYSAAERSVVYARMRERARDHLARGRSVILDATHLSRAERDDARALAREFGVTATCVEITADDEVIRERIEHRRREGISASEATWAIYLSQKQQLDALGDDELPRVTVDAASTVTANIDRVLGTVP